MESCLNTHVSPHEPVSDHSIYLELTPGERMELATLWGQMELRQFARANRVTLAEARRAFRLRSQEGRRRFSKSKAGI